MAIDKATVMRRKAARAVAIDLADLVRDTLDDAKLDCRDIIRAEVRKVVGDGDVGTIARPIQPMTDCQSQAFGQELMPYGKYRGCRVDSVPLDYLIWLADNKDGSHANLRQYCLSRRIQDEQE